VCTASPNPASPSNNVTITCQVGPGSITTIPGADCPTAAATGTSITCTGTGATLGNNPPATATYPSTGDAINGTVPLQITPSDGSTPPLVPTCTATPNPQASGASVTITCKGGQPGDSLVIPNTSCAPATLVANEDTTCTGTAGTGTGQVSNNPPVTVTDPDTNLSNNGTVPFQVKDSTPVPPLPSCTANPNPAQASELVTITCTGGQPGDSIAIPGANCSPNKLDASGGTTCTGLGGAVHNNPPVTVTDPGTGAQGKGTVPLVVIGTLAATPVPTLGQWTEGLLALMLMGLGLVAVHRSARQ
jgi:hypothetical protein